MSKLDFEIKEGNLVLGVDSNEDGEKAVKLNLVLSEAIEEAFSRGQSVEGVKLVDFKFELTKLKLKIDTDQDGESVLDLEIDLGEAFDEISSLVSKK